MSGSSIAFLRTMNFCPTTRRISGWRGFHFRKIRLFYETAHANIYQRFPTNLEPLPFRDHTDGHRSHTPRRPLLHVTNINPQVRYFCKPSHEFRDGGFIDRRLDRGHYHSADVLYRSRQHSTPFLILLCIKGSVVYSTTTRPASARLQNFLIPNTTMATKRSQQS